MQNTFLSGLDWRYAVKSFDPSKKVSDQDIQKIKDAIRLAPTSYGLQPFRVVIVQDRDIKNKLKSSSFNQPQVDSSSHIFIFVAKLNVQKRIGEYCDLAGFKSQGMFKRAGVEAVMRGALLIKNAEEKLR